MRKKHHFARAKACPRRNVNRVTDSDSNSCSEEESESSEDDVGRVLVCKVSENYGRGELVSKIQDNRDENVVTVEVNGTELQMRVDSGCKKVLIPEKQFNKLKQKGRLVKTKVKLRPYGMTENIEVKGRVRLVLRSMSGSLVTEWGYVVVGHQVETLLGSSAAKALGILQIIPEGKQDVPSEATDESVASVSENNEKIIPLTTKRLVEKYSDLFKGIGQFSEEEVDFHIDHKVKPVVQKERLIPLGLRDKVSKHLEELKADDVIEGPLDSTEPHEWVSNVRLTRKSDGQIRMNLDMRHANTAIQETHFSVPNVQELRHKLNGAVIFSKLDLRHAFHQMKLGNKSRRLTTFYTHQGLYRFKRLVMGASPASQEFHEKFRLALLGLDGVLQIEDDLLVYGSTQEEHDRRLGEVLERLLEKGVTLRKEKCMWSVDSVIWFGYKFSADGMSPDPAKVATIQNLPAPKNVTEVRSFLQMCQYSYMFLFKDEQTYSDRTAPLRTMLQKNARFKWTKECQESFKNIKKALSDESIMGHWVQGRDTELWVDRGPEGLGATLYQREPSTGYWKPITYHSRALKKAEKNYSPMEGESLAIKYGILINKLMLHGNKFVVKSDHEPLQTLYNNKWREDIPARVDNHRMKVQAFDFKVVYKSGKQNPTDYNSRHALSLSEAKKEGNMEEDEEDDEVFVNFVVDDHLPDAVTLEMIQKEVNKSDAMAKLKYCILKGKLSDDIELIPYRIVFPKLSVAKQIILRGKIIVIPASLQGNVIALAHVGHQGSTKTKQYLRHRVWFPGMDKMVEAHVQLCLPCLSATPGEDTQPLRPSVLPERPWQKLACDFKGPVGNEFYFLLVIDEYSRYPEVEIVTSTKASEVIPKFEKIFATHGVPDKLKTDNGPPFKGHDMKAFANKMGFHHQRVEPMHPQSNGLAENFMRMLLKVAHTAQVEKKDPRREVYKYLMAYRATPHSTTGVSPSESLFGRQIKTAVPSLLKNKVNKGAVRRRHQEMKKKQKEWHDHRHHVKKSDIEVGDSVLLKQRKTTVQPPYDHKPWVVVKKKGVMITARRGKKELTRDVSQCRRVPKKELCGISREVTIVERPEENNGTFYLPECEKDATTEDNQGEEHGVEEVPDGPQDQGFRRSVIERRPPSYLSDYVK